MRIPVTAVLTLLSIGSLAVAQPGPGVGARADATIKLHDRNSNGRIEWQEVQATGAIVERLLEQAGSAADPEAARAQVLRNFESRLERMPFLLSDANRDLVVTGDELRKFLTLSDMDRQPEPGRWHHEQLMKVWVAENWVRLHGALDRDGDNRISPDDLLNAYPGELTPADARRLDLDADGQLDQAEYAAFKAAERAAGVFINEIDNRVGTGGGAGADANADDDGEPFEAGPDAAPAPQGDRRSAPAQPANGGAPQLKPGSSWQHRDLRGARTRYTWYRVVFLNGEWLDGMTGDPESNVFKVQHYSSTENASGAWADKAPAGCWSAGKRFAWPRDDDTRTTIKVPAGEFQCLKSTTFNGNRRNKQVAGVRYFIERNGIPILVQELDASGKVVKELVRFNP